MSEETKPLTDEERLEQLKAQQKQAEALHLKLQGAIELQESIIAEKKLAKEGKKK